MKKKCWIRRPRQNKSRPLTPNEAEAARQAATLSPAQLAAITPRQRLDSIHALQAYLDYQTRRGELVELREVEEGHAEMREVIKADLLAALGVVVEATGNEERKSTKDLREFEEYAEPADWAKPLTSEERKKLNMLLHEVNNAKGAMKEHAGDCTIYAATENGSRTDGICTCGYGLQRLRLCDPSEMQDGCTRLVNNEGVK